MDGFFLRCIRTCAGFFPYFIYCFYFISFIFAERNVSFCCKFSVFISCYLLFSIFTRFLIDNFVVKYRQIYVFWIFVFVCGLCCILYIFGLFGLKWTPMLFITEAWCFVQILSTLCRCFFRHAVHDKPLHTFTCILNLRNLYFHKKMYSPTILYSLTCMLISNGNKQNVFSDKTGGVPMFLVPDIKVGKSFIEWKNRVSFCFSSLVLGGVE